MSTKYLKRAARRFLSGTRYRSPYEAVEAGVASLMEWSQVLSEEREADMIHTRRSSETMRLLPPAKA